MPLIGINEKGYPVGQDHHRAKYTNDEVEALIAFSSEHPDWGYGRLGKKFDMPKDTVRSIMAQGSRAQRPVTYRRVKV